MTREELIRELVNERFGAPPEKRSCVKRPVKPTDKVDRGLTCGNTADQEGGGIEPTPDEQ